MPKERFAKVYSCIKRKRQEKHRECIARYIEEEYVKTDKLEKKWVELLDYYRDLRHNDQYSTDFYVNDNDSKKCLETAKEFVKRMDTLIS